MLLLVPFLLWSAPPRRAPRVAPRRVLFEDLDAADALSLSSAADASRAAVAAAYPTAVPAFAAPAALVVTTALALFNRLPGAGRDVISARAPPPPPAPGSTPLAGTRWSVVLDFGREKNTWMPPAWAASGRRVEVPLLLELGADGAATPLRTGACRSSTPRRSLRGRASRG